MSRPYLKKVFKNVSFPTAQGKSDQFDFWKTNLQTTKGKKPINYYTKLIYLFLFDAIETVSNSWYVMGNCTTFYFKTFCKPIVPKIENLTIYKISEV